MSMPTTLRSPSARTAWDEMSTPAEFSADCRAAEAHLATPSPRLAVAATAPEHRFEDLRALAATVSYELD